jgi:hypothetical protein
MHWPTCVDCSTEDGLPDVALLPTSAASGEGLQQLREVLIGADAARKAALPRISADFDTVTAGLTTAVGRSSRR